MPSNTGPKTGFEGKAYVDPSGVGGSTWQELKIVGDIQPTDEKVSDDVNDRDSDVVATVTGRKRVSHQMTITFKKGDSVYQALRDAYYNGTLIGVAIMDEDITQDGAEGWQYDAEITQFPRNEPLDGVMTIDAVFSPSAHATTPPAYVVVSGS